MSVTRQVTLNGTKSGGKCQNWKTQMRHFEGFSNAVASVQSVWNSLKMSNSVKQCYQTCQYPIRQNAKMRQNETFLVIFKHSELRVQLCFGKTFFSNVTENKSFSGFFSQLCIKHSESLQHFWLLQSIIFRIFPLQKKSAFSREKLFLDFH